MAQDREQRHTIVNELVSMPMAAHRAHFELCREKGSDADLNAMAEALADLLTVYTLSGDRTSVTPLSREIVRSGSFGGAGGTLRFSDGREELTDLAVKRSDLLEAIEVLKRGGLRRARS